MAHQFDQNLARLALEICRFTYAAGIGNAANAPDRSDALAYLKAHSNPLADPIPILGGGTSFACVVPYADRNVVSYMGTKTEFGFNKLAELDDLLKSGQVLTMLPEAKSIIEQFRDSLRDWGQNGKARPVAFELEGRHIGQAKGVTLEGRVHHGFLSELKAVQEGIVATLNRQGGVARPVLVTGHSQGGAEAALATRALAAAGFNVEVTYTFAAPRTGSAEFVNSVKTPVHRIEFGDDIVPHLPPTLIKTALEEIVAHHPVLLVALKAALHTVEDFGYVGLGPLCYGHPNEQQFHADLSATAEKALFEKRLKLLPKSPKHWGEHHHLAGTTAEVAAGERGNYTVLVSPNGWPVALNTTV